MSSIKFSIVTPIYNHADFLGRYFDSILPQIDDEDEIVLIDDGSSDHINDRVEKYRKKLGSRLQYHRHQQNRGVSAARNTAIQLAQNNWIKFLDADDFLMPNALAKSREIMASKPARLYYGLQKFVEDGPNSTAQVKTDQTFFPVLDRITTINPFVPSMVIVDRKTLVEVNAFDERIRFEEDWDLWLRIYQKYGKEVFCFMPFVINGYFSDKAYKMHHRQQHIKTRNGIPVRDYFREKYGINPIEKH